MIDSRMVATAFREPTLWTGRFVGAGTNTKPTTFANTTQRMYISTYSNTGSMVITLADSGSPGVAGGQVGRIQLYSAWVNSGAVGGANAKAVQLTPPANAATTLTLQIQYANGTAVDIASTEELCVEVWTERGANT